MPSDVHPVTNLLRQAVYFVASCEAYQPDRFGKLDFNFRAEPEDFFDGKDWSQAQPGQPFFAHMHFPQTHRPFRGDPEMRIDPDCVEVPPYLPDHPLIRLIWSLYLEDIQVLDRKIGEILTRLEAEGLSENTVVFFTGDHGRAMVRCKQWLYDGGIQIPLLVRWPEQVAPGSIHTDPVSMVDMTATWLGLAEVDPPTYVSGRDLFSGSRRECVFAARDRCDETVDRIRCVRTTEFKYIRNFYPDRPYTQFNACKRKSYPELTLLEVLQRRGGLQPYQEAFLGERRPEEELYDIRVDPYEVHNLAGDSRYQSVMEKLRGKLTKWLAETQDQGQTAEDFEEFRTWQARAQANWDGFVADLGFSPLNEPDRYLAWWEDQLLAAKNRA